MPHELITVTNDTYINAQSVCDLLRRIAQLGFEVPITLVTDNARYTAHGQKLRFEPSVRIGHAGGPSQKKSAILTDVEYKHQKFES